MKSPYRYIAGIAVVAIAAAVYFLGVRGTDAPSTASTPASETTGSNEAAAVPPVAVSASGRSAGSDVVAGSGSAVEGVTIDELKAALADTTVGANPTIIAALDSRDPVVVAEAANEIVGRGVLSAIPQLVEMDVINKPWAAPSAIYAMGKLAKVAEEGERSEIVERLLALLAIEKTRGAQESGGNMIQIYEALGDTGDPAAIKPLENELADPTVPTAPKVTIVGALVALDAQQSKPVLQQVADKLVMQSAGDDLEAQIRRDLLDAIKQALVALS